MLYIHTHTAPPRASCLLLVDRYHWACVATTVPCGTKTYYPTEIGISLQQQPRVL